MPTTQTQLFPPPQRGSNLPEPLLKWLFSVQNLLPLRTMDTSGGSYSEALPPAGLNSTTGQSNQNQELIYIKTTADANMATITGADSGPVTLKQQFDCVRFKSDGTNWYQVALQGSGVASGVTSVFGRTGVVVAQAGDYAVAQVTGAAPLASPALTGVPTAPTPGAGDNSTKIATTAFVEAALGAAAAPFMFGPGIFNTIIQNDSLGSVVGVANTIAAVPFFLPSAVQFSKIAVELGGAAGSPTCNLGIYNSAFNKVVETGVLTALAGSTVIDTAVGATTLAAGTYWLVWAGSSSAISMYGLPTSSLSFRNLANVDAANPKWAKHNANWGGGALPASLTLVASANDYQTPLPLFH